MPIDILFYGNSNPHRKYVFDTFASLAGEYGLRVEFYSHTYGSFRDAVIDQSKIVLNIGAASSSWFVPFRRTIDSRFSRVASPCFPLLLPHPRARALPSLRLSTPFSAALSASLPLYTSCLFLTSTVHSPPPRTSECCMFCSFTTGNWALPLPADTTNLRGNTINEHRIRYLLSKGKVVVSERTGIHLDEVLPR